MTEPAWVRSSSGDESARAMPKSVTLDWPVAVSRTLPGFTSRCTTPREWAKPRAAATSPVSSAARRGCNGPSRRMTCDSDGPSMYSMTMKYVPSWVPQS